MVFCLAVNTTAHRQGDGDNEGSACVFCEIYHVISFFFLPFFLASSEFIIWLMYVSCGSILPWEAELSEPNSNMCVYNCSVNTVCQIERHSVLKTAMQNIYSYLAFKGYEVKNPSIQIYTCMF